jgi:hypothetical protein
MTEITPEFIQQAITDRPNRAHVETEAAKGLVCYYGGPQLEPYVVKYSEHENIPKLKERREKAVYHYKNHVRRIASQYVEGVYGAGPVVRKTTNPTLQAWLDEDYHEWFTTSVALFSLILPELYIHVKPRSAASRGYAKDAETMADVDEMKLFPVPCVIFPQHVQNFCQEETGTLSWIVLRHKKGSDITYEIITETERLLVNTDGKVIEPATPHGFPSCPVVRMVAEENHSLEGDCGHAFMSPVVQLTLANLNVDAMSVEAAVAHLSPKLVTDKKTADNIKATGIGNYNLIIEGDGSPQSPTNVTRYLQMNGFEFNHLREWGFEALPEQIMEEARLRDRNSTRETSGYAKLLDSVPEIGVIKAVARYFQTYENHILPLVCEAYQTGLTGTAVYPKYDDLEKSVTGEPTTDATPNKPDAPPVPSKRGGLRETPAIKEATE